MPALPTRTFSVSAGVTLGNALASTTSRTPSPLASKCREARRQRGRFAPVAPASGLPPADAANSTVAPSTTSLPLGIRPLAGADQDLGAGSRNEALPAALREAEIAVVPGRDEGVVPRHQPARRRAQEHPLREGPVGAGRSHVDRLARVEIHHQRIVGRLVAEHQDLVRGKRDRQPAVGADRLRNGGSRRILGGGSRRLLCEQMLGVERQNRHADCRDQSRPEFSGSSLSRRLLEWRACP